MCLLINQFIKLESQSLFYINGLFLYNWQNYIEKEMPKLVTTTLETAALSYY